MKIKIGTRASQLAMWQANFIKEKLENAGFETEIAPIETKGDKVLNVALSKIGSKGVFTEELEEMLQNGNIHIAVHSAKDMQSDLGPNFEIIAFTEREFPGDVLVADNPIDLTKTQRIGSSSVRRVAFFKKYYPNLELVNIRGNLQTRIKKMQEGQCDALCLAFAGVNRMGYNSQILHHFPLTQFIPPVGQGTVAVEIAKNLDSELKENIKATCNHLPTEQCLLAERAFLQTMSGGCSIPSFCYAQNTENGIRIHGGIIALDGSEEVAFELEQEGLAAKELGEKLAKKVLENGGREILSQIKQ